MPTLTGGLTDAISPSRAVQIRYLLYSFYHACILRPDMKRTTYSGFVTSRALYVCKAVTSSRWPGAFHPPINCSPSIYGLSHVLAIFICQVGLLV